jgi:hypothetical protein
VGFEHLTKGRFRFGETATGYGGGGPIGELPDRRQGLAALFRQAGDVLEGLDLSAGIGGLPVVATEGMLADREDFLGGSDRLRELPGTMELVDGLGQLLDALSIKPENCFGAGAAGGSWARAGGEG